MAETLLDPDEPDPVTFDNETGRSVFFLTCDHAGRAIPRRLDGLGLPEHETRRHIAWDIGIGAVGRQLSRLLDAAVVLQTYSRLVIDCNRDPKVPSSIPEISEVTEIPGNRGLTEAARTARVRCNIPSLSRHHRGSARPSRGSGPHHGIGGIAQLHPGLQGRGSSLACGSALQSRRTPRPSLI